MEKLSKVTKGGRSQLAAGSKQKKDDRQMRTRRKGRERDGTMKSLGGEDEEEEDAGRRQRCRSLLWPSADNMRADASILAAEGPDWWHPRAPGSPEYYMNLPVCSESAHTRTNV